MTESTTPTPEPMGDEQLAEIREAARPGYAAILAQLIKHGAHDLPEHGKAIVHGCTVVPVADLKAAVRVVWFGAPALVAGVERLRAELAAERRTAVLLESDVLPRCERRAERAEAERDQLTARNSAACDLHTGVCSGACGLEGECACEDRDLVCQECNDRWPCPTRRALEGTEATS